jgi:hypothetical protein
VTVVLAERGAAAGGWQVTDPLGDPERRVMTEVRGVPRPESYTYVLPAMWFAVSLRPASSMKSIRQIVDSRVARFPALAEYRKQMLTMLRGVVNDAMKRKVERLSLFAEPASDGAIAAASMSVLRGGGVELPGGEVTNHPVNLAEELRADSVEETEPRRAAPDREIGLVALAQQVVVRTAGLVVAVDPRTGHTAESYQVQYAVPIPGTAGILLLTFSTPCGWAVDDLTVLFDLIATTFHWEWGPEPDPSAAPAGRSGPSGRPARAARVHRGTA